MEKNSRNQLFNTAFIFIGAALLIYDMAYDQVSVYIKIAGLVFLMFGLYRATRHWAAVEEESKKEKEDEV